MCDWYFIPGTLYATATWNPFKLTLLGLIRQWSPMVFFCHLRCRGVQRVNRKLDIVIRLLRETLQISMDIHIENIFSFFFSIPECPQGFISKHNTCYKVHKTKKNRLDAFNTCRPNGYLVHIKSSAEQDAIAKVLNNTGVGNAWIGLSRNLQKQSFFNWTDDSPLEYETWAPAGPRNFGCVIMAEAYQHRWITDKCKKVYAFVCEYGGIFLIQFQIAINKVVKMFRHVVVEMKKKKKKKKNTTQKKYQWKDSATTSTTITDYYKLQLQFALSQFIPSTVSLACLNVVILFIIIICFV